MTVLSALLAAAAFLVLQPVPARRVRQRLGIGPAPAADVASLTVGVGIVVVAGAGSLPFGRLRPATVVLALVAACVGVFVARQVASSRRRRLRAQARAETTQVVDLVAAELHAGLLPGAALSSLAVEFDVLEPAARVAELGGDVAETLREAASAPGREGLVALAGAWYVAERAGAPLAAVLERVAAAARDDEEVRREIAAGISPARASGRVMALLPLVGLALASGMGADPVGVVTTTLPGALAVAAGAALACTGIVWVDRIAATAEAD